MGIIVASRYDESRLDPIVDPHEREYIDSYDDPYQYRGDATRIMQFDDRE